MLSFFPSLYLRFKIASLGSKDGTLLFRQRSDYTHLYENWDIRHLRVNVKNGLLGVK